MGKKKLSILVALALIAIFAAVIGVATSEAGESGDNFRQDISGSSVDSVVDMNVDGIPANVLLLNGQGAFGHTNTTGLIDFAPKAINENCPDSQAEFAVAGYSVVHRVANGDMVFAELIEGFGCTIPNPSLEVNALITGGTGIFEGASGHYQLVSDVFGLSVIPGTPPNIVHAAFDGQINGSVSLGNENGDE